MNVRKSKKGSSRGHVGKIITNPRREVGKIVVIGKHPASCLFHKAVALWKKQFEWNCTSYYRNTKSTGIIHSCVSVMFGLSFIGQNDGTKICSP